MRTEESRGEYEFALTISFKYVQENKPPLWLEKALLGSEKYSSKLAFNSLGNILYTLFV